MGGELTENLPEQHCGEVAQSQEAGEGAEEARLRLATRKGATSMHAASGWVTSDTSA